MFNHEAEQAESWMAKREAILASGDVGSSLDSVEALIKKHEDYDKSLQAQVLSQYVLCYCIVTFFATSLSMHIVLAYVHTVLA